MPSSIEFRGVSVDSPTGSPILRDLTLRIEPGQSVALIGRSGAGKTSALRLVNGLALPSHGDVRIDDVPLAASDVIALRRRTGYIIQGSGLFPHRSVYENVATVPRLLRWAEPAIEERAAELLQQLGLPFAQFAQRMPRSLSGGEQQRVGIARAMIAKPSILLCDEPFGALDPIVRRELQDAFIALRGRGEATIVFVTHDLAEAMRVAERIIVIDAGRIVADTPSRELPALMHPLVRRFIESATLGAA